MKILWDLKILTGFQMGQILWDFISLCEIWHVCINIITVSKCNRHSQIWATSWQNQQNDCAPSEDSDQPGHPPSLISLRCALNGTLLCAQWVVKDPSFLHADSQDSDQTGRMPRLIWVFAGCTYHFVGFVMRWLIWTWIQRILYLWFVFLKVAFESGLGSKRE